MENIIVYLVLLFGAGYYFLDTAYDSNRRDRLGLDDSSNYSVILTNMSIIVGYFYRIGKEYF
ncbi:hypothetical protein DSUL_20469 [Desulfovibrionales bacterium]